MKVLFDTNIILDVLLNREAHVDASAYLMNAVENRMIQGGVCATTITTIDYLISKYYNRHQARLQIGKILNLFEIFEVNSLVLRMAVESEFLDFEDAVQNYAAEKNKSDGIVTRNEKDFTPSRMPVYSPNELSAIVSQISGK